MPFKAVVESLDEVEELSREFYKEMKVKLPNGAEKTVFALDVEGVDSHPGVGALKNAHERQKAETAKAKARVAELEAMTPAPEGFSAEEWERLKAVDEEVKKGSSPDNKKVHEAEIQSVKAMFAQQIEGLKKKAEADIKAERDLHLKTKESLRGRVVGDDLTKALVEAGVDKKFLSAARALLERSVKVTEENGSMVAMIPTDLGEQPIEQFVPQWAQSDAGKHFLVPATGGGASGSDGKGSGAGTLTNNPFTKASWNMTQQAQLIKNDPAKADRFAKAAGHPAAIGARIANAK